ncbi:MAG: helix-turn-helix domain-containing protein [Candidatus Pacebacteria bacterium]|nr:helix-turn-helix domain-containing protein [Candidatus Paceibacterota bacterium]
MADAATQSNQENRNLETAQTSSDQASDQADENVVDELNLDAESLDNDRQTGKAKDAAKLDLNNLPDLLTVREVADLLRVSPLTIKRWGKRGKLPAIRINSRGDRRYKKESVLWLLGIDPEDQE